MRLQEVLANYKFKRIVNKYKEVTFHFQNFPFPVTISTDGSNYYLKLPNSVFGYKKLGNLIRNQFISDTTIGYAKNLLKAVEIGCDEVRWHATYFVDDTSIGTVDKLLANY